MWTHIYRCEQRHGYSEEVEHLGRILCPEGRIVTRLEAWTLKQICIYIFIYIQSILHGEHIVLPLERLISNGCVTVWNT